MKFIDTCDLDIIAGNGGNGIVSFRREARVARGGPNGGDGGHGGNIYFVGDPGVNTLLNVKLMFHIRGNDGENGRNKDQTGANGKHVYIKVPLGTVVYDSNRLVCDVVDQKEYLIASGGRGGRGNTKFKSSKNTAPLLSENGDPGQKFKVQLTLKVLADVGFVGKPSAGKSTLLSKVSNAKPKIADYAFTTLNPQLGFVKVSDASYVVADLPGLIEGAAQGKGLGHEFLKHIERCRVIAHVIDFGDFEKDPIADFKQINNELKEYKLELENRKQVVVANKSDLEGFEKRLALFKKEFKDIEVISISALTEKNIEPLKMVLYKAFINSKELTFAKKTSEVTIELEDDVVIEEEFTGSFEVSGVAVERIYNKIPLTTVENTRRFHKLMRDIGVWDELRRHGIVNGDMVRIFGYEFEWDE